MSQHLLKIFQRLPNVVENVGRFSDDLLAVLKLFKRQQFQRVVIIHVLKNNLSGSVSDPGCKPAVEKETYSPRLPNNFLLSLWPGQKSA